ncbi:TetR/AcrR family transcriptional regulator [Zavarzinia compransoris]|uniref:TetR/AcrR family transcriptional regulator n=1 Tax=Zavarzinia marina TaxID=2911065 RepID=UPI001F32A036|nr:TetR/AcrR family transcriptional regulator [Zavarzinia marina]MCF4165940.1 TetR/AcrR family transcriptional regulator [Zavarzinia marina]
MKKRPGQGRSRATVEAVLEATAQLLAETGYGALTTNHIAERAGVSIGSVYQYFPGKEAVVAQVVERVVDDVLADFSTGLLAGPTDNRRIAAVVYDAIDRRAALVRALTYEIPFLRDLPAIANLRGRLLLLASQIYMRTLAEKPFTHPHVASFILTAMVRSAVLDSILNPLPGMTREQAIDTLAEIIARIAGPG